MEGMNETEPETPGVIEAGGQDAQVSGSDEPGVITVDVTDFHRHPAESANPSVGNKQARIVKSTQPKDVTAEGENRWFQGRLVRRPHRGV